MAKHDRDIKKDENYLNLKKWLKISLNILCLDSKNRFKYQHTQKVKE